MVASVLQFSALESNNRTITVTAASSIVAFAVAPAGTGMTCSDSVNGSYGAAKITVEDNNGNRFVAFAISGAGAGSTTVTVANADGVAVFEAGGVKSSGAYDGQNSNVQPSPGTAADTVTSGTITPSAQPALLVAMTMHVAFFPFATPDAGTGFTNHGTSWGFGGANGARFESLRVTSTSAVAATFSPTSNSEHASLAILLLEDTGGGGGGGEVTPVDHSSVSSFPVMCRKLRRDDGRWARGRGGLWERKAA